MNLYAFYYNWVRSHLTLCRLSPIFYDRGVEVEDGFERFIIALQEVVATLKLTAPGVERQLFNMISSEGIISIKVESSNISLGQ